MKQNFKYVRGLMVLSAALFVTLILVPVTKAQAQSCQLITVLPSGQANSEGAFAFSTDGVWRGDLNFRIAGSMSGNGLNLFSPAFVKPARQPQGEHAFYRLSFNSSSNSSVQRVDTADYTTLTVTVPAKTDHLRSLNHWIGNARVVLKLARRAGLPDQFRIEFAPTRLENPNQSLPRPSGLIVAAQVRHETRSDITLTCR
jgi:hypothetical protein